VSVVSVVSGETFFKISISEKTLVKNVVAQINLFVLTNYPGNFVVKIVDATNPQLIVNRAQMSNKMTMTKEFRHNVIKVLQDLKDKTTTRGLKREREEDPRTPADVVKSDSY